MNSEKNIDIKITQKAIDEIYILMQNFELDFKSNVNELKKSLFKGKDEKAFFGEYFKDKNFSKLSEDIIELEDFIYKTAAQYSNKVRSYINEDFYRIKSDESNFNELAEMPDDFITLELTALLQSLPSTHKNMLKKAHFINTSIDTTDVIIKNHFKNTSVENNPQYKYVHEILEQLVNLRSYAVLLESGVLALVEATNGTSFGGPICKVLYQDLINNIYQQSEICRTDNSQLNQSLGELIDTERTYYVKIDLMNKFFTENESKLMNLNGLNSTEYSDIFKSICIIQDNVLNLEKYIVSKLESQGNKCTIFGLTLIDKIDILQAFEVYVTEEVTRSISKISSTMTRIGDSSRINNLRFLDDIARENKYLSFIDCSIYPIQRICKVSSLIKNIADHYYKLERYKISPLLKNEYKNLINLYEKIEEAKQKINKDTQNNYQVGDVFYAAVNKMGLRRGDISSYISSLFRQGRSSKTQEGVEQAEASMESKNKPRGK